MTRTQTAAADTSFPVRFKSRFRDENNYLVTLLPEGGEVRVTRFDDGAFKTFCPGLTTEQEDRVRASVLRFERDQARTDITWLQDRDLDVPPALWKQADLPPKVPAGTRGDGLEERARQYATVHARIGQRRKYTGESYLVHLEEVANIVRSVPHTEEMLAAAWLHDVVDDTTDDRGAELAKIEQLFGKLVASYVEELSDVSSPNDGNRAVRKAIDRAHAAKASPRAKSIRLADLISNVQTIVERCREFAMVYLPEKAALVDLLREGDAQLWAKAKALVDVETKKLGSNHQ